jgi:hypothetical protein
MQHNCLGGEQTAFLQNTIQSLRPQFRINLDFIPSLYPVFCRQATCHGQTIYDPVTVLISIAKATAFNYLSIDCATTGSSHYPTCILMTVAEGARGEAETAAHMGAPELLISDSWFHFTLILSQIAASSP